MIPNNTLFIAGIMVPAEFVYNYLKEHKYHIKKIDINKLTDNNILPHWCPRKILINNQSTIYDYLSIADICEHITKLKQVSLSDPIIVINETHIVDGTHRLIKHVLAKRDTIKAYVLTSKDFDQILNAYKLTY